MPEIPPPPLLPSEPEFEPEPELPSGDWFAKLKKWGGLVAAVSGILAAGGTVWKTVAYIDELHDTIGSNKAAVAQMVRENTEAHEELESKISTMASAVRSQRDRDQEIITQLRIAVGALQAARGVRAGRMTYEEGVQGDRVLAAASGPSSARMRREQAAMAEEDAEEAIQRVTTAQIRMDTEDPLAALEGL